MKNWIFKTLALAIMSGAIISLSGCTASGATLNNTALQPTASADNADTFAHKVNLGKIMALYPKPITVVGVTVDGKVNWRLVGHTGIIGHNKILVSMKQSNYTNRGIFTDKKLSINLVSRQMLPKADYVGSVKGSVVDKSQVFDYSFGENGSPIINESPLSIECNVVDVYESEDFDNFICEIANTYAASDVLNEEGNLDYSKLKPVLYTFPTYEYLATGEVIGDCLNLKPETSMVGKDNFGTDGIIRLLRIEVYPEYLDEYIKYVTEVGEASLRTESGVLTMYAVQEKDDPCKITILETYASQDAYKHHIATDHFHKYKQGTAHMVKELERVDHHALNPASVFNNYIKN